MKDEKIDTLSVWYLYLGHIKERLAMCSNTTVPQNLWIHLQLELIINTNPYSIT